MTSFHWFSNTLLAPYKFTHVGDQVNSSRHTRNSVRIINSQGQHERYFLILVLQVANTWPRGGALGYFLGGYVPPGTPNWHPVLKKKFP